MRAVYSNGAFKEIVISGSALEWNAFALALKQDGSVVPCEPVENPAPYSHCADEIHVLHRTGEKIVIFSTPRGVLIIQGDPTLIEKLSETALNFGNDFPGGTHIHIDYQGDSHFVAGNSTPTVFTKG